MGHEGHKNKAETAPEELISYSKWWTETYGRAPNPDEYKTLNELAKSLAKKDDEFKQILAESLTAEFLDDGLEDQSKRKWALVSALSTYGKKFGLTVD